MTQTGGSIGLYFSKWTLSLFEGCSGHFSRQEEQKNAESQRLVIFDVIRGWLPEVSSVGYHLASLKYYQNLKEPGK